MTSIKDALIGALASLAAAISILERTPKAKKAVASDKMFDTMLDDYRKALEIGRAALTAPGATTKSDGGGFQDRVRPWMLACFGPVIPFDKTERNHRFLEEALELVQSIGCTQSEAHQLVDYVFGRPVGEPAQEVGGVMVTLAALCIANDLDMAAVGETELARIWTKVEAIRAKQAAKPKHSPLPGPSNPSSTRSEVTVEELALTIINARRRQNGLDDLATQQMKKIGLWPLKQETLFAARALLDQFEIRRKM
jgi:hypothetical protein